MSKEYKQTNIEPAMAAEPAAAYGGGISVTNALWTLIASQAQDVQLALRERLNQLFPTEAELKPYTLEELNARLDESEHQMEAGDVMSGEQVHMQMREYLKTLRA